MANKYPEELMNYNRFPGDHVIATEDGVIRIGDRVFHLVHNYRDAFNAEKLEQRYSDVFDKFDYVVGDWGHEQLRLKGFYSARRKKMPAQLKISDLSAYVDEYMNFGAPFFVIKRMRKQETRKEEAYTEEKVYEVGKRKPKFDKRRRNNNQQQKKNKPAAEKKEQQPQQQKKRNFTIRTREK
jgi:uncharacterized protein YutD